MTQQLMRHGPSRGAKVVALLIVIAFTVSALGIVPVTNAATPSIDCGGGPCPTSSVTLPRGNEVTVIPHVNLTTTSRSPLIVAIISSNGPFTIAAPSDVNVTGAAMNEACAPTGSKDYIAVFTLAVTGSASHTVYAAVKADNGGGYATMIVFGISGSDGSIDGTCSTTAGYTNPTEVIGGLSYSNDLIIAGAAITGNSSASISTSTSSASTNVHVSTASINVHVSTASISAGISIASVSPASGFVEAAKYIYGSGAGPYTISWTAHSTTWQGLIIGVVSPDKKPNAPLFPEGIAPILLAIPLLYLVMLRRRGVSGSRTGVNS
ncbi:MAG: hypothetical protein JRM74_04635 [Nitrososphaerota archaeon]|nr:hypothetical protein [Nitrososphaerota archaeon]